MANPAARVHAVTAHAKRYGRKLGKRFRDEQYAFEEAVTELGSTFLCTRLGIEAGSGQPVTSLAEGAEAGLPCHAGTATSKPQRDFIFFQDLRLFLALSGTSG
ncbi:zincin-like metallopeptidase domain-containing protein [Mesorhizobium sp. M1060]|uniref:zincin-like metallopeptidase domain-containing protein n=1 Tax=unclassified Mesorhizobium TaxID=325217 RepID=UPI001FD94826|nr:MULTISPECIES: zincin-like metallopeptidase domain-containing protein [unclassified Mesorhizobium]WJI54214.1 zincin-like metallopeptidase domain-containing protein [Mesorhizobium sp. C089B]